MGNKYASRAGKAFDRLRYVDAVTADGQEYYIKRTATDSKAREDYLKLLGLSARDKDSISIWTSSVRSGRTTMNAYDKIYSEDASHNFGVMVDCAVNTLGCPAGQFWHRFLASSIARRFSLGAVDIIAGHSGVELALMVLNETGLMIDGCDTSVSISSKEYWAGITLARYQWSTGLTFKELTTRGLGLTQTIAMFNPLHEAEYTVFE